MRVTLIFVSFLLYSLLPAQVNPQLKAALTGDWEGMLNTGMGELKMILHIQPDSSGKLDATLDSPYQGAYGIETAGLSTSNDTVTLSVPDIGGSLHFEYKEEKDIIAGTWQQGSLKKEIVFSRMDSAFSGKLDRPQEPEPPYPYVVKEVTFRNDSANITLAGTLTLPDTTGKFPAVVLVTGSGPQNRDEELMGHKPFKVIADHLSRNNIAVLRYDDRGVGKSQGFFSAATSKDFAQDAISAINFLENHPNIKTDFTGIAGHSEGGLVAPMAANQSDKVDFVILIAGPAVSGDSIMMMQGEIISRKSGESKKKIELNLKIQQEIFQILRRGKTENWEVAKIRKEVGQVFEKVSEAERDSLGLNKQMMAQMEAQMVSPWMRFFATYDPKISLQKLDIPVLAVYGTNDLQVPLTQNKPQMEKALAEAPTNDFEVVVFEGLNHLMQPSETGLPSEYGKIETTFSPEVLEKMSQWIISHAY